MTARTAGSVVVLDRDGTIVVDRHYLNDPEKLEFLPRAAEGLRQMYQRGHRLVVITNQSGVGRGRLTLQRLEEIHRRLHQMVEAAGARLERIYYCPHRPDENCDCRKPRSGLLLRAAAEMQFDPTTAVVIGDKDSDIEFGRGVGARSILIAQEPARLTSGARPDHVTSDLAAAAGIIDGMELMSGRR